MVDWAKIRDDFPTLKRKIDGKSIVYFDTACMALKPKLVIDAISYYYNQL
ncbi:MAG: cysteine desulfurase CsdA, partial [Candidatus Heimdallarchaeota archaeon]|nr:cysteine desulfurase CsdA [Candidatus Heimdallarchaeota archaeon]